MRLLSLALCVCCALAPGCHRAAAPDDAISTDDARLEMYSAELEENRLRLRTGEMPCAERCDLARRTCEAATGLCRLWERNPGRADLESRCGTGREECALASNGCDACRAP